MNKRLLGGLAAAGLAATLLTGASPAEDEVVSYRFRAPLDNGRGVTSIEDLRGKPVLIDFWGTR